MTLRLLLDDMLSGAIADQLGARGHDATAIVSTPDLLALPDAAVLAHAAAEGRVVVTRNIKDFVVLDARQRAEDQPQAGIVLVSANAFPADRHAIGALVRALDALITRGDLQPGALHFLQR